MTDQPRLCATCFSQKLLTATKKDETSKHGRQRRNVRRPNKQANSWSHLGQNLTSQKGKKCQIKDTKRYKTAQNDTKRHKMDWSLWEHILEPPASNSGPAKHLTCSRKLKCSGFRPRSHAQSSRPHLRCGCFRRFRKSQREQIWKLAKTRIFCRTLPGSIWALCCMPSVSL